MNDKTGGGEPLSRPAPYSEPYDVFVQHYLYHLARRRGEALPSPRPTLGELAISTRLSRQRCRRFRRRHEEEIRALEVSGPGR